MGQVQNLSPFPLKGEVVGIITLRWRKQELGPLLASLKSCPSTFHLTCRGLHGTGVLAVGGNEGQKPGPQGTLIRSWCRSSSYGEGAEVPGALSLWSSPNHAGQGALEMQNINPSPARWLPIAGALHRSTVIKMTKLCLISLMGLRGL